MGLNRLCLSSVKNVFLKQYCYRQYATAGCFHLSDRILTSEMKIEIENHWKNRLTVNGFDPNSNKKKQYVLAMFPYPSGNLHMGHVRVYAISDAMARYYRLNDMNVLHPMGWDAFGLPAENAAIQRNIPADKWTKQNIETMRKQLDQLQLSFDWNHEVATCDAPYYKWTQKLFLMMFNDGLAYQKEALVNWDPIDKTVLADEQVDPNGNSWRSGAKVEKKVLKQWFVKATKFSKNLLDGLDNPVLEDWRDIIKLQKHWIGECDGYSFDLKVDDSKGETITIWTKNPEHFKYATHISLKPEHILNKNRILSGTLDIDVINPFTGWKLPLLISSDEETYPLHCDSALGANIVNENEENAEKDREEILKKAQEFKIGGYPVSSKLKDWLISRQRFWGTPIPIVHCDNCGPVAVPDDQLPIELPKDKIGVPLIQNEEFLLTDCSKCGSKAKRETDTMDTFVDSSWYFLRFLDPTNDDKMFDEEIATKMMPVDLYVGGKEHAVLHLYYARFINHFLHSKGLVKEPEPFKRLLVQGMVMGKSYRVKGSGKYLPEHEVQVIDEKKGKAIEISSGSPVVAMWEKMSKSKLNGVDPIEVLNEHGCDTLRLIILGDVAPTSHRNWSSATFPGLINWQKRIWLTMHDFHMTRSMITSTDEAPNTAEFMDQESKLFESRNYFTANTTFNFKYSHQLSVAISKMQGLTNVIRRAPTDVVAFGRQYERAVAALIIMMAPMAPHFSSELWSRFVNLSNRLNPDSEEIRWNLDVLQQNWPVIDENHQLEMSVRVNGYEVMVMNFAKPRFNQLTHQDSLDLAFNQESVVKYINNRQIKNTTFTIYPNCLATLNISIYTRKADKVKENAAEHIEM